MRCYSRVVVLPRAMIGVVGLAAAASAESARVIVIGIDGLSVDAVARTEVPHLRRLMRRAAWTLEARESCLR